ncbi:thiamine diphosphokinase [Silicimonas algicola]|uniref:Thiamine diphosphokinase n=1 Tax=Silicimonas algicola TaxID=1826607 RepID=A0A316G126_9RHOB|nr:thiamine diphosphokinase [Silicimonas algicola]PWK54065.1 thiamine diphosphokinase [Silicimonas algicola]
MGTEQSDLGRETVQSDQGVTLVGGGRPSRPEIDRALALAPVLIAADGGANFCLDEGLEPVAVIGDFDSVRPGARTALSGARFLWVEEQESTDFEKCLTAIRAPFVLAAGFTDGRLDHTLAAFSVLVRTPGAPTILVGRHDIAFAAPARLTLDVPPGLRLSLFPMAPVTGRSAGLRWPIEGLSLDPMGRIGTSNETTGPVRLSFDGPGCVVLMPPEALPSALSALTAQGTVPER